ncbi:uncharacterized protein LOC112466355 [Temnothorax curvispinosus]|uniref:Uncharacterized protein LOC112466355 n=1 Tax=Temnothorax curvispinosus TaxID=300111 RepID=A0A6J1R597_9HYME|nr:uncharacterized protein LOC112466355 [Temnothorax curvispinosus]XP_024890189.1 uncharacterized protein LOC112466355 [Temnothorax curvispinosus]
MEIVITTGFQKVTHEILFQPETIPKGKQLVNAGHVCDVKECRRNNQSYLIEAQVIRQTSVSSQPYRTKLNIDADRKVTLVSCTCVYNKSGKCKHIAALIHYINNEESLSKTDFEQQWGKPTTHQLTKEKYSKGKYFCDMFPPTNKFNVKPVEVNMTELPDPSPLKTILLEIKKDKNQKAIQSLMDFMLTEVERNLQKEDCASCLNTFFTLCDNCMVYMKEQQVQEYAKNFYCASILLTRKEIVQLCCDTLEQSKCDKWFQARSIRLSASTNIHSIKIRNKKTIEKLVSEMLESKKVDTPGTRYGIKHEVDAMTEYENMFKVNVKKVGLLVCEKQPWLCASLDGVVTISGCVKKIVEFKCPITCEKMPVVDFENKKCNVKYLVFEGNEVRLKTSVQYYTQCQTQMYVSGMKECDLFIYSPVKNGCCCTCNCPKK